MQKNTAKKTPLLQIRDLCVSIENKRVLDNLNLQIEHNEVHAIMGPNGSGKSSLCNVIMGHPKYVISKGEMLFEGRNLNTLPSNERALLGLFLAFQHPQEVPGITFGNYLRQAVNLRRKEKTGPLKFFDEAKKHLATLKLSEEFVGRGLNAGLSGGEKKRAETAQLLALQPKLAILDEIDSGLDIDALKQVASALCKQKLKLKNSMLLITHYQRLLHHVNYDRVHIMVAGKIVKSGGEALLKDIEKNGYDKYRKVDHKKANPELRAQGAKKRFEV